MGDCTLLLRDARLDEKKIDIQRGYKSDPIIIIKHHFNIIVLLLHFYFDQKTPHKHRLQGRY
ncbi:hypothetical protein D7C29_11200 [Salmonella enterica]|nr:hypothetical protein [Salmonella enterica]ECT8364202.1 hypothetical protein [Salmonella enterica]MIO74932.1 hypothetical protein [Salmonella enterica subsp. houtenae]